MFQHYVDRVCADMERDNPTVAQMGGRTDRIVDSIYMGGGTPTGAWISRNCRSFFVAIAQNFEVQGGRGGHVRMRAGDAESGCSEALQHCGVTRVSLGVQSFVDKEAASVGRQHDRKAILEDDIASLRAAGITSINIDLIAGLPHRIRRQLDVFRGADDCEPGASRQRPYILEVDEDLRLGRELIAGGSRYHAHFVPDEDLTADLYSMACERLEAAGVRQYEISNFAGGGFESHHNLKYWTRQPYLGFGVDAHSMLPGLDSAAVRFSFPDSLEAYVAGSPLNRIQVSPAAALEETFFLGLRLTRGVNLGQVASAFGGKTRSQFGLGSGLVGGSISQIHSNSGGLTCSPYLRCFRRSLSARQGGLVARMSRISVTCSVTRALNSPESSKPSPRTRASSYDTRSTLAPSSSNASAGKSSRAVQGSLFPPGRTTTR